MVLTALDDETATSSSAASTHQFPSRRPSRYWFGDFLLLWRPPMAVAKALDARHARRGRDAGCAKACARRRACPPPRGSDVYDDDLTRLVQDFQRQHRLNVDGVAGVQTQIVLDTRAERDRVAARSSRRSRGG